MVEHLFERRRGVVVEVRGSVADSVELGDVHHPEVGELAREEQSPGSEVVEVWVVPFASVI